MVERGEQPTRRRDVDLDEVVVVGVDEDFDGFGELQAGAKVEIAGKIDDPPIAAVVEGDGHAALLLRRRESAPGTAMCGTIALGFVRALSRMRSRGSWVLAQPLSPAYN